MEEGKMIFGQRITRMKRLGRGWRRGQRRAVRLKKHCSNAMAATTTAGNGKQCLLQVYFTQVRKSKPRE